MKILYGWILFVLMWAGFARAVEIPLDTITPIRIGYIDLQKVFDTYPEKSFAEGDLLRELEKRRRNLTQRQASINALRGQIDADQAALSKAKRGEAIVVPVNAVPEPEPAVAAAVAAEAPAKSTSTAVEPYPMEDPLAGLPGHEAGASNKPAALPGVIPASPKRYEILDQLADSGTPQTLTSEQQNLLNERIGEHQRRLDKEISSFRRFRSHALGDMKQLQAEKTYGVMARIYAILQQLARDEGVSVVMDKAFVLYGEDTVDLSDKLIARLQSLTPL